MSQCPKNQINGACGGSDQGWCEVYPDEKQCIWVRAYDRLKVHPELRLPTPPLKAELRAVEWVTPSYFFSGRNIHEIW